LSRRRRRRRRADLRGIAPKLADVAAAAVWTAEALLAPPAAGEVLARRGAVSPDVPAYVIYTSGSTGKPKGILITQRSICHFLRSENAVLGVTGEDKVYQGFSVAFDMSFENLDRLPGRRHAVDRAEGNQRRSGNAAAHAGAKRVTVLHAVPTLLALFNRRCRACA
jgi:non-ribosomal peptide synthetase component F